MTVKHIILLFGITTLLIGCDAYKVVKIVNKSSNKVELFTDFPQTTIFIKDSTGNYKENVILLEDVYIIREKYKNIQIDTISQGLVIKLEPSQSFEIAGHMGSAFIKIQPLDLNFSRLTIYTMTDTIKAKSKNEILELLDNEKTKYIKSLDKNEMGFANKFHRYIVIRH